VTDITKDVALSEAPQPPRLPLPERRGRRRRPTGAPPPLPRKLGTSGKVWLALAILLVAWVPLALAFQNVLGFADRADTWLLRGVAHLRTAWLTRVATRVDLLATGWLLTIVGLGLIVALIVFRRWRHLLTFLGGLLLLEFGGSLIYFRFARPRPYGVTILGRWAGFAMPSPPVAIPAALLVGLVYTMIPAGRGRTLGKWLVAFLLAALVGARLYLGTDHPSDVIVGIALAVGLMVPAFRWFTPNEVFPVRYRQGKTAHLDVGGERGEAIRRAVEDQLGLTVVDLKPVGLAGSGGSTPLRLTIDGDPPRYLFAKLYAMNHVRADRWYKLGRTILYGRMEDETPFQSVRRLVGYEDYMLRLLRDYDIPTATPYGIVEITPEREYILVTEFFDGAVEMGDAEVDDRVIDDALLLVRRLWDAGVAHRDVKPANLLVRDGKVLLIDVFFVQVRPSPWRQAVDLANMMLVLGVCSDPERVYRHALRYFTPDEIAEAFAAARGVASPSQLRTAMKRDGRDLLAQFRALAPPRKPIAIQRWSIRRVALALGLVAFSVFAVAQVQDLLRPVNALPVRGSAACGTHQLMVLVAQSVPSATRVPCIDALPAGWRFSHIDVRRNRTRMWFDSDKAGTRALEVSLLRPSACNTSGAMEVPSDEVGTRRYERPERLPPELRATRFYTFDGGCVTYRYEFAKGASASLQLAADSGLTFESRSRLVRAVDEKSGLDLCGANVRCPGGAAS
jgi:membrane-associated phospholipid phosphatase/serine/threonine protein kinase